MIRGGDRPIRVLSVAAALVAAGACAGDAADDAALVPVIGVIHGDELIRFPIPRAAGGTDTGVAATWQRNTVDGISFIVELGPALPAAEADAHAGALLELATMVASR